jgi:hypothetical protein
LTWDAKQKSKLENNRLCTQFVFAKWSWKPDTTALLEQTRTIYRDKLRSLLDEEWSRIQGPPPDSNVMLRLKKCLLFMLILSMLLMYFSISIGGIIAQVSIRGDSGFMQKILEHTIFFLLMLFLQLPWRKLMMAIISNCMVTRRKMDLCYNLTLVNISLKMGQLMSVGSFALFQLFELDKGAEPIHSLLQGLSSSSRCQADLFVQLLIAYFLASWIHAMLMPWLWAGLTKLWYYLKSEEESYPDGLDPYVHIATILELHAAIWFSAPYIPLLPLVGVPLLLLLEKNITLVKEKLLAQQLTIIVDKSMMVRMSKPYQILFSTAALATYVAFLRLSIPQNSCLPFSSGERAQDPLIQAIESNSIGRWAVSVLSYSPWVWFILFLISSKLLVSSGISQVWRERYLHTVAEIRAKKANYTWRLDKYQRKLSVAHEIIDKVNVIYPE